MGCIYLPKEDSRNGSIVYSSLSSLRKQIMTTGTKPRNNVAKRSYSSKRLLNPVQEWSLGIYVGDHEKLTDVQIRDIASYIYRSGRPDIHLKDLPKFSKGWYQKFWDRYVETWDCLLDVPPPKDFYTELVPTPTDLLKMEKFCEIIKPGISPETAGWVVLELKKTNCLVDSTDGNN